MPHDMNINSAPGADHAMPRGRERVVPGAELNSRSAVGLRMPQGHELNAALLEPASGDTAGLVVPQGQSSRAASPDINSICIKLQSLQRERRFYIRAQQRLDRATESFIAMALGFEARNTEKWGDGDKKAAKALFAAAKRIRMGVERGETEMALPKGHAKAVAACSALILSSALAREHFDKGRKEIESEMIALAKRLPVFAWVEQVRGVNAKGLAIVVAEAGNLSGYPKKGHLWKRLGLSVHDGKRQGSVPSTLSSEAKKEAWKSRGYNPSRRAEMFALFDDVMLRAQWQHQVPLGPYGAHYARKKAEYVAIEKPYADKSARRYMTKQFIRDLWNAWRAAGTGTPGMIE